MDDNQHRAILAAGLITLAFAVVVLLLSLLCAILDKI